MQILNKVALVSGTILLILYVECFQGWMIRLLVFIWQQWGCRSDTWRTFGFSPVFQIIFMLYCYGTQVVSKSVMKMFKPFSTCDWI